MTNLTYKILSIHSKFTDLLLRSKNGSNKNFIDLLSDILNNQDLDWDNQEVSDSFEQLFNQLEDPEQKNELIRLIEELNEDAGSIEYEEQISSIFATLAINIQNMRSEQDMRFFEDGNREILEGLQREEFEPELFETEFEEAVTNLQTEDDEDSGNEKRVRNAIDKLISLINIYKQTLANAPNAEAIGYTAELIKNSSPEKRIELYRDLKPELEKAQISTDRVEIAWLTRLTKLHETKKTTKNPILIKNLNSVLDWQAELEKIELEEQTTKIEHKERIYDQFIVDETNQDESFIAFMTFIVNCSGNNTSFEDFKTLFLFICSEQSRQNSENLLSKFDSHAINEKNSISSSRLISIFLKSSENRPLLLDFEAQQTILVLNDTKETTSIKISLISAQWPQNQDDDKTCLIKSFIVPKKTINLEALSLLKNNSSLSLFCEYIQQNSGQKIETDPAFQLPKRKYPDWYRYIAATDCIIRYFNQEMLEDLNKKIITGFLARSSQFIESYQAENYTSAFKQLIALASICREESEDIDFLIVSINESLASIQQQSNQLAKSTYITASPLSLETVHNEDSENTGWHLANTTGYQKAKTEIYNGLPAIKKSSYENNPVYNRVQLILQYKLSLSKEGPHDPKNEPQLVLYLEANKKYLKDGFYTATQALNNALDLFLVFLNEKEIISPLYLKAVEKYLLENIEILLSEEKTKDVNIPINTKKTIASFIERFIETCERTNAFNPLLTLAKIINKANLFKNTNFIEVANKKLAPRELKLANNGTFCFGDTDIMSIFDNPFYSWIFGEFLYLPFKNPIDENQLIIEVASSNKHILRLTANKNLEFRIVEGYHDSIKHIFIETYEYARLAGTPPQLRGYTFWKPITDNRTSNQEIYYLRNEQGSKIATMTKDPDGNYIIEDTQGYKLKTFDLTKDSIFYLLTRNNPVISFWERINPDSSREQRIEFPDLGLVFYGNTAGYSCRIEEERYYIDNNKANVPFVDTWLPLRGTEENKRKMILKSLETHYILYELTEQGWLIPQNDPTEAYLLLADSSLQNLRDNRETNLTAQNNYFDKATKAHFSEWAKSQIAELNIEELSDNTSLSSDLNVIILKALWLKYKTGAAVDKEKIREHLLQYNSYYHSLTLPDQILEDLAKFCGIPNIMHKELVSHTLESQLVEVLPVEKIWQQISKTNKTVSKRWDCLWPGNKSLYPQAINIPNVIKALQSKNQLNMLQFFSHFLTPIEKELKTKCLALLKSALYKQPAKITEQHTANIFLLKLIDQYYATSESEVDKTIEDNAIELSLLLQKKKQTTFQSINQAIKSIYELIIAKTNTTETATAKHTENTKNIPEQEFCTDPYSFPEYELNKTVLDKLDTWVKTIQTPIEFEKSLSELFTNSLEQNSKAHALELRKNMSMYESYITRNELLQKSTEEMPTLIKDLEKTIKKIHAFILVHEAIIRKISKKSPEEMHNLFAISKLNTEQENQIISALNHYKVVHEKLKAALNFLMHVPLSGTDREPSLQIVSNTLAAAKRGYTIDEKINPAHRVLLTFERLFETFLRSYQYDYFKTFISGNLKILLSGTGTGKTFLTQLIALSKITLNIIDKKEDKLVIVQPIDSLRNEMHKNLRKLFYRSEVDKVIEHYPFSDQTSDAWSLGNLRRILSDLKKLASGKGALLMSFEEEMALRAFITHIKATSKSEEMVRICCEIEKLLNSSEKLADEFDQGLAADKYAMVHHYFRKPRTAEIEAVNKFFNIFSKISPEESLIEKLLNNISTSSSSSLDYRAMLEGDDLSNCPEDMKVKVNIFRTLLNALPELLKKEPNIDYGLCPKIKLAVRMEKGKILKNEIFHDIYSLFYTRLLLSNDEAFRTVCQDAYVPVETNYIANSASLMNGNCTGMSATGHIISEAILSENNPQKKLTHVKSTEARDLVRIIKNDTEIKALESTESAKILDEILANINSRVFIIADGAGYLNSLGSSSEIAESILAYQKKHSQDFDYRLRIVYFDGSEKKAMYFDKHSNQTVIKDYEPGIDDQPDVVANTMYYLPTQMAQRGTDVAQTIYHKLCFTGAPNFIAARQGLGRAREVEGGQKIVIAVTKKDLGIEDKKDQKTLKEHLLKIIAKKSKNNTAESLASVQNRLFYLLEQLIPKAILTRPDSINVHFKFKQLEKPEKAFRDYLEIYINKISTENEELISKLEEAKNRLREIEEFKFLAQILDDNCDLSEIGPLVETIHCVPIPAPIDFTMVSSSEYFFSILGNGGNLDPVPGTRLAAVSNLLSKYFKSTKSNKYYALKKSAKALSINLVKECDLTFHKHFCWPVDIQKQCQDTSQIPLPLTWLHLLPTASKEVKKHRGVTVFDSSNLNLARKLILSNSGAVSALYMGTQIIKSSKTYSSTATKTDFVYEPEILALKLLQAAHLKVMNPSAQIFIDNYKVLLAYFTARKYTNPEQTLNNVIDELVQNIY